MKEELLRILNIKLKYIEDNIQALNKMNTRLELENEKLDYMKGILNLFENTKGDYEILHFEKLERDDFNKVMMELDDEVLTRFGTTSCNYDGLMYLISGINKGISLALTDEQKNAIDFMIESMVNRQMDYLAVIDGVLLAKSRLEISDMDTLVEIKENYSNIIKKLERDDYVSEIDEITDAIDYVGVDESQVVEIFSFLLKYNAEIYHDLKENDNVKVEEPVEEEFEEETSQEEKIDLTVPFSVEVEEDEEKINIPIIEESEEELPPISFDVPKVSSIEKENEQEALSEITEEENELEDMPEETEEDEELNDEEQELELPIDEEFEEEIDEDFKDLVESDDYEEPANIVETEESKEEDVVLPQENTIEEEKEEVETAPSNERLEISSVRNLFDEYKVKYDELEIRLQDNLLTGNIENYREVLTALKEKEVLELVAKNQELLVNLLLNSNKEVIEKVLEIVEKDLSVDADDNKITTKIVIMALPSIFVKEPNGNYENFVKNIESLKEWKVDLINLFDFSREVFVANNEKMKENYEIIKSYNLNVNDKNAKYYLVLPNIEEKLDYYIESVVRDNMKGSKGELFDGSEYVKLYPNKLNSVTDLTIKRLRYSSETGKKIFGSKEKSLTGEITNLKVDILKMEDEYLRKYFNNEFDNLTHDEVEKYIELIKNNKDNNLKIDSTLESLDKYKNDLRYVFDGVNVSSNKLVRNYNTLIKNDVPVDKALVFAACYNSVITKDEYQKVKEALSNLGGK